MEILLEAFVNLFPLVYVIIFFGSVFVALRFEWGKEGKDERGIMILNKSYRLSYPLFPLGWFIIFIVDEYVTSISYDIYKDLIWFLMTGLIILHAILITIYKRVY